MTTVCHIPITCVSTVLQVALVVGLYRVELHVSRFLLVGRTSLYEVAAGLYEVAEQVTMRWWNRSLRGGGRSLQGGGKSLQDGWRYSMINQKPPKP